ncbi:hypothetical protein [Sphaerisporangium aureirubrum]|uniref:Uncharacterized protein n=1 Tax=Sphaerisporangium aureirubrum TaxID=1544736 RepID=A0ABW1NTU7_9ACTN
MIVPEYRVADPVETISGCRSPWGRVLSGIRAGRAALFAGGHSQEDSAGEQGQGSGAYQDAESLGVDAGEGEFNAFGGFLGDGGVGGRDGGFTGLSGFPGRGVCVVVSVVAVAGGVAVFLDAEEGAADYLVNTLAASAVV